ncbi:MAG: aldehyde dehydrogenase family protein [Desulfobacterales bacterium]|jgi:aldehyde dehydrogenase (NAD+)
MTTPIDHFELSGIQDGAGSGTFLKCGGESLHVESPIDGKTLATIKCASQDDYESIVRDAEDGFLKWRATPAPKRGDIIRQIGEAIRNHKEALGALISIEAGKISAEGEGEVQEAIDIADFALGQSRMLYGLSMHSERPGHRMFEQWHPLGPVGVITAFNFPVAPWAWNAMIALAAGDPVIWKPSSKTPLSAIALMKIIWPVFEKNGLPRGLLNLVIGGRDSVGEALIQDSRIPLVSATGSVPMGRRVANAVASRLGRSILELGGNNAIIVTPKADLDLAVRGIVFGAVGTAGQRCTTTRRVIAHRDILTELANRLVAAYRQVVVGDPLDPKTLMGPMIDKKAVDTMQSAIITAKAQGGEILWGGEVLHGGIYDTGTYVEPCLCMAHPKMGILREETFAPILYLLPYDELEEAITYQNDVPQGLSSAIFTDNLREAEGFLSHWGSDCGIANVNIGTSGAEIGGAFGGEKETGGGREAGSDVWKSYMRRQTCTVNWSGDMPLAQGIRFEID